MAKRFLDGYNTYDTSNGYGNAENWRAAFRHRMSREDATAIIQLQQETPHQILGVSPNATKVEIKKAFRTLITIWHPDKNQHRIQEAEAMSKKIIAAYTILS